MTTKQETAAARAAATVSHPAGGSPVGVASKTVPDAVKSVLPVGAFMTADHRYYLNGQGPVPSVTTVLEILSKPALVIWKAQATARALIRGLREWAPMAEEDAVKWALRKSDEERDTAASLGTGVHLLADMAARGSETDSPGFQISEATQPYLEAFRGFLSRYSASSIVSSEKIVWSKNGYAGTYDLLMMMPCAKHFEGIAGKSDRPSGNGSLVDCTESELWLIDIKTSKGYYPEYGLQLAAYRWADSIILPGDPREYPMPEVKRTGILHLRPDQYQDTGWRLIEYPTDYQLDYIRFLGALELYQWRKEGRFSKTNLKK